MKEKVQPPPDSFQAIKAEELVIKVAILATYHDFSGFFWLSDSQGPFWEPHFLKCQLSDRGFAHQIRPGKDAGASQSGFPRWTLGTRKKHDK
ncbi:MAG TPA: hypothetical protein PKI28_09300 [Accumulibacter sp.]|nr:hypothetical protein [Accumulibacter sp.]